MKNRRNIWMTLFLILAVVFGFTGKEGLEQYLINKDSFSEELEVVTGEDLESEEWTDDNLEVWEESSEEGEFTQESESHSSSESSIDENGTFTDKYGVAAYIYEYGHLPSNYITKKEARELGWDNQAGNLQDVAPGKSIGGDVYKNYEKMLPIEPGRTYYECDIDYEGGYRNEKRIIYSNDGLIFYTEDHYKTFEPLY